VSRYLPTMAIWTIGSLFAGITASERYHRFFSILNASLRQSGSDRCT
jgi:hypothetical protein